MKTSTTPTFSLPSVFRIAAPFLLLIGFLVFFSNHNPFGRYRFFMVLSGSMKPAIDIGSIVLVCSQSQYLPHDIITFHTDGRIVTHRVVTSQLEASAYFYVTQGDANVSSDQDLVSQSAVIGKVILAVPYIGRLVAFAQSPPGLVLLVLLPGLVFLFDRLFRLSHA